MAKDTEFCYDWLIKLSPKNTTRYEALNKKIWTEAGIGVHIPQDRFICTEKPESVQVLIRKTYTITLQTRTRVAPIGVAFVHFAEIVSRTPVCEETGVFIYFSSHPDFSVQIFLARPLTSSPATPPLSPRFTSRALLRGPAGELALLSSNRPLAIFRAEGPLAHNTCHFPEKNGRGPLSSRLSRGQPPLDFTKNLWYNIKKTLKFLAPSSCVWLFSLSLPFLASRRVTEHILGSAPLRQLSILHPRGSWSICFKTKNMV